MRRVPDRGRPPLVAALPAGGVIGDQILFQTAAMAALSPPVAWQLMWDGSKWVAVGGAPLVSQLTASTVTSSSSYVNFSTAVSVDLPAAGDYDISLGARCYIDTTNSQLYISYAIGGTAPQDADALDYFSAVGSAIPQFRVARKTGLSAVTVTAKLKTGGLGTTTVTNVMLSAAPVRLG